MNDPRIGRIDFSFYAAGKEAKVQPAVPEAGSGRYRHDAWPFYRVRRTPWRYAMVCPVEFLADRTSGWFTENPAGVSERSDGRSGAASAGCSERDRGYVIGE
jgi:hypothetical protein